MHILKFQRLNELIQISRILRFADLFIISIWTTLYNVLITIVDIFFYKEKYNRFGSLQINLFFKEIEQLFI